MRLTRPDLCYICLKIASVAAAPAVTALDALDCAGCYAFYTPSTALCFSNKPWTAPDGITYPPDTLIVFVDTSFATEGNSRSQTGIIMMLNGSQSGQQSQLADSTGYAETIALHEAAHLVIVYQELLTNLGYPQHDPTPVYEENSAAWHFVEKGFDPRSMHHDIKYLFVHKLQDAGVIKVIQINTKLQLADICTKPCKWSVSSELLLLILGNHLCFSNNVEHYD
jgi:hypothetical protein